MTNEYAVFRQQVVALHAKGLNDGQIARQLKCHRWRVVTIRRALDLPRNWTLIPLTPAYYQKIRALHARGFKDAEICRRLGRPLSWHCQLCQIRKKLGLASNYQPLWKTLNLDQVRQLVQEGCSDMKIGQRLGVSSWVARRGRQELGLPPKRTPRRDDVTNEDICRLHAAGHNDGAIAQILNTSSKTIFDRRKSLGLPAIAKTFQRRPLEQKQ